MKLRFLLLALLPHIVLAQVPYPIHDIDSLYKAGAYALAFKVNSDYLSAMEGSGECRSVPLALYKSGEILDMLKSRTEAYRFFHSSLSRARRCKNDSVEWLATRYLGGFFYHPPIKDSVRYYLEKAYFMIKDKNMPREISSVTGMLGETMSKIFNDEREGLRYYKISLDYAIRSDNYAALGYAYLRYGAYLAYHDKCSEGIALLEKSLQRFSSNKDAEGEVWAMTSLSEACMHCKRTEQAYLISQTLVHKQDSLFSIETAQQTARYQILYETDKKARENLQLTKDNQLKNLQIENEKEWRINLVLSFGFGLLVVSSLFVAIYRQHTRKKKGDLENKLQSERERISRELHDNIGTQLSQLSSSLDWAGNIVNPVSEGEKQAILTSGLQITKEVISDLRASIWALKKTQIPFTEFADKLKNSLKDVAYRGVTIPVHFEEHLHGQPLGSEEALDLLRICQEAVSNALQHSGCSQINLSIYAEGKEYQLKVEDNGSGYESVAENNGHYGLENIKARAHKIKARLVIESHKEKGTTVIVSK